MARCSKTEFSSGRPNHVQADCRGVVAINPTAAGRQRLNTALERTGELVRYFTSEWWSNGCRDTAPIDAYRAHFRSISSTLPPSVVEFEEQHTLHDSRLESTSANYSERTLALRLRGWDRAFSQQLRYSVLFLNVSSFEQTLPMGRDVDSELGDIGYWEYQVYPPHVELRILFASGAQLHVLFGDVRFAFQPSD